MLRTVLITVPFLLSAVMAYTLPGNQADGVYRASLDARGNEVHTLVAPAIDRQVKPSIALKARDSQLSKRSVGNTYCGCGFTLDHQNTDDAVADLKHQVGDGDGSIIDPAMSYYSIRGSVVAFACNLDPDATLDVYADIIGQSAGQITDACGLYIAGSAGAEFSYAIGYMRNADGLDFCGNALTSGSNHC